MNDDVDTKSRSLLILGAEVFGGGLGALVGFAIAGPAGIVIGGAATPLITEFSKRLLSSRQKARVGATILYAKQTIIRRISDGAEPNPDFFIDKNNDGRPDAQEVWEGVLLNAQQEYEERKIPYYGNLFANIAFEKDFDKARANFLLKLASNLSYRQLCLISIFAGNEVKPKLRATDYRGDGGSITQHLASVLHEIMEMHNYGIVSIPNDTLLGITDIAPAKMHVQGAGVELRRLMELNEIPITDLQNVADALH